MSPLDRLERIFGRFAIPNLSLYLVVGQVFVLLGSMFQLINPERVALISGKVAQGEWWRLITFLFFVLPPTSLVGYVFLAFRWYLLYLMGNALEQHWGAFRYNVFLLLGTVLTIGFSFLTQGAYYSNTYLLLSVFLAFAVLNPDFELLLIIIPVKIKWLALLTGVVWAANLVTSGWSTRLQIIAPTLTLLVFFAPMLLRGARQGRRASAARTEREREAAKPRHVCYVCGKTDLSHPDLDFRYCSKCAGDQCYCPEHIQNHAHVVAPDSETGR